jgi:hypothetical protein
MRNLVVTCDCCSCIITSNKPGSQSETFGIKVYCQKLGETERSLFSRHGDYCINCADRILLGLTNLLTPQNERP